MSRLVYAYTVVVDGDTLSIDLLPRTFHRPLDTVVQYDERTGIAYTRPTLLTGADNITTEELDWLGLGPGGENL